MAGGSSSSARRRTSGGMAGARGSRDGTSSKQGRSLQEISIPEGMDEEVQSTASAMIGKDFYRTRTAVWWSRRCLFVSTIKMFCAMHSYWYQVIDTS